MLCVQVERKLEEAEQQLQQQNGGQDQHQLTPRPSDWGPDQQLAEACKVSMCELHGPC